MPLPRKLTRTIEKFAKRDGKIAKKFYPYVEKVGDLKLYVLAQNGRGAVKWNILGIVDKWGVEFNQYRDRTMFSISTNRTDFGKNSNESFFQIAIRASHIAKENGEIYSIRDGDGVQAFYFDFSYRIFGIHEAQKTFDLSVSAMES